MTTEQATPHWLQAEGVCLTTQGPGLASGTRSVSAPVGHALAHCPPDVAEQWEAAIRERDAWTEPADGPPIADPPGESIRQAIGDPRSPELRATDR